MDAEVEDSDATVAPDIEQPMSDDEYHNEEAAGEKSPSFLNSQAIELDERVEYSQSMSPELPLASVSGATKSSTTPNVTKQVTTELSTEHEVPSVVPSSNEADSEKTGMVVDGCIPNTDCLVQASNDVPVGSDGCVLGSQQCMVVIGSSEPETTSGLELDDIIRQQTDLLHSLQQTPMKSSNELKTLRARATELETSMKEISIANQRERKELAIKHSSLSQQSQSQHNDTSVVEDNESLRRQLMSLASKQKTLLQCFKTQKELVEKLERESNNIQAQAREQRSTTSHCVPMREKSRETRLTKAAIPNIVQHLKTQSVNKTVQPQKQHQPLLTQHNFHPLPIFNTTNKTMAVNTEQLPPPTTSSGSSLTTVNTSSRNISQVELAVPVPLLTLIQHHFIQPDNDCLSYVLMGCEFKCSIMKDGTLCTLTGVHYKTPNQWVHSCWLQLGQHKHSIKTKFAFKNVMYRGIPLMNICEQFNKKQVSLYHQMIKGGSRQHVAGESEKQEPMNLVTGNTTIPGIGNESSFLSAGMVVSSQQVISWNENDNILMEGQVLLIDVDSVESLDVPAEFWKANNVEFTPQLVGELENDFDW